MCNAQTRWGYNYQSVKELGAILFALISIALMVHAIQIGRRTGRGLGKVMLGAIRPFLRRILTVYYRRKVTRQMQNGRQSEGKPPLENPYLD